MSEFTYKVTVTTERNSGLIASKDEQSDPIADAISEALEGFDISSIGARSDSEYTVTDVAVEELEKISERELNAEYEQAVRDAEPTDSQLRAELKDVMKALSKANSRIKELEHAAERRAEALSAGETRIYQRDSAVALDAAPLAYLKDGVHDRVTFKYGDRWDEVMEVGFLRAYRSGEIEGIEVRASSSQLSLQANTGNAFEIRAVGR